MTDTESPIFASPADDPEMEQAAAKARQTFRFFWREMSWEHRRIIPALELAAVKGTFSDPPEIRAQNPDGLEVEHMWLIAVSACCINFHLLARWTESMSACSTVPIRARRLKTE